MTDETTLGGAEQNASTPTGDASPQNTDPDNSLSEGKGENSSEETPTAFDRSLLENGDDGKESAKVQEPETPMQKSSRQTREEAANKQIEVYVDRVLNGDIDIDDEKIPKWIRPHLENLGSKVDNSTKEPDYDLVDPKSFQNQILEQVRMDKLLDSLPNMTASQQKTLAEEAGRLKNMGMSQYNAWREAISRSEAVKKAEERGMRASSMYVPSGGTGLSSNSREMSASAKEAARKFGFTEEDIKKYYKPNQS